MIPRGVPCLFNLQEQPSEELDKDESPRSPADIYELYQAKSKGGSEGGIVEGQPKSILKHSDVQQPIHSPVTRQQEEKRQPLPAPVSVRFPLELPPLDQYPF